MAMEVEPDLAFLEDVYDRRWEKLSIMKYALAAYHSSGSPKRAKKLDKVESSGHRHAGRFSDKELLRLKKDKGRVKKQGTPSPSFQQR